MINQLVFYLLRVILDLLKGGQYFRAKEFKFNLLKKEGIIKDAYGILDIKNVLDDLKIDSNSNHNKN